MKNPIVKFRLMLLVAIGFLLPNLAISQAALVQIIHNSPDPRNDTVDVWVGNTKLIDNFLYQAATPFVPVPSNTRIEVRISDYNSTDTSSTFRKYFQAFTFAPNSRQAIVALGNVTPAITNASNAFRLLLVPNLRGRSTAAGVSQAVAVHGIPDGPTIDGVLRGTGIRLADDMSFGESQGYHELIRVAGFADLMDTTASTRLLSAGVDFSLVPDTTAFIILASGYLRLPSGANSTRGTKIMAVLPSGGVLAPNLSASIGARVQIIHNAIVSSDSIAVWINGLRETTLQYRKATNYVARATTGNTTIHITGVNVADTSQAFYRANIQFDAGKQYQIFTAGLQNTTGVVNPDGQPGTLQYLNVSSRELSSSNGLVDVKVIHGSVDVGTIDIRISGTNTVLVDNLQYGGAASYISIPPTEFPLEITNADGTVVIGRFTLNLNGLAGKSVSIIASGLISPLNNNQPSFALVVVKADGSTTQVVPVYPTAFVQVIHNCADAAAAQVDVYVNGARALDNFPFRAATGFVPVAAAHSIRVVIAPSTSSSEADGIYTANYTLAENSKTILVATGLIATSNYRANPNGVSTAFRLAVVPNAHVGIPSRFNSKRAFFMGVTDMPTTGLITYMPTSTISPDTLQFGERLDFDGVNSQLPFRLTLDTNQLYSALQNSIDTSCVVIASGFYNATGNQAGNPMIFLQVNSDGRTFILNRRNIGDPIIMDFAKVQLIHNCADTLASSVDVYLDGMRMFQGLGYRSASRMDFASAGVPFRIAVAPAGSTSVSQAIDSILVTFEANKKYVVLVEGLVTPNNYRANPNGLSTALKMRVIKLDDTSRVAGQTKVAIIHSSTDAPTVGLNVSPSGAVLIPDTLSYGENTQYLTLPAQSTSLYLSPLPNLIYTAPLNAFSDSAIVVVASGFLNNTGNQASKPFSLLAITEGGRVIPLPVVNSTKALQLKNGLVAYPNPVDNGVLCLKFTPEQNSAYHVRVLNTNGSVMYSKDLGTLSTSDVDMSLPVNFASGMYVLQLLNETGAGTSVKFSVK